MPDLQVDADLRLRVTASNGESTTARITGNGQVVRVDVERPDILFASVDNADVGRIADLLAEAGLAVHVEGPDGRAAVIGAGASSRIGKLVTAARRRPPRRHPAGGPGVGAGGAGRRGGRSGARPDVAAARPTLSAHPRWRTSSSRMLRRIRSAA